MSSKVGHVKCSSVTCLSDKLKAHTYLVVFENLHLEGADESKHHVGFV